MSPAVVGHLAYDFGEGLVADLRVWVWGSWSNMCSNDNVVLVDGVNGGMAGEGRGLVTEQFGQVVTGREDW